MPLSAVRLQCILEASVTFEALLRARCDTHGHIPRGPTAGTAPSVLQSDMQAALAAPSRAKVYEIGGEMDPRVPPLPLRQNARTVEERIGAAFFTGKGDLHAVLKLFRDYQYKMARAAQERDNATRQLLSGDVDSLAVLDAFRGTMAAGQVALANDERIRHHENAKEVREALTVSGDVVG